MIERTLIVEDWNDGKDRREPLISIMEAARRLGLSSHTIRAWVRQGRFPYIQLGRRLLIDCRDVEGFIKANRVEVVQVEELGE